VPADEVCGTVDAGVHARGSPWTRYNWIPTGASNSINRSPTVESISINRTPDGRVDFHHPKSEINESPQTKPAEPSTWESMPVGVRGFLPQAVPQIAASPPSAGTHYKRTPDARVDRINRTPDGRVDFLHLKS
jgi:hypothetical protein